jgi:hypothetical protein
MRIAGNEQLADQPHIQHRLAKVRKATKLFRDVRVARRAGYPKEQR